MISPVVVVEPLIFKDPTTNKTLKILTEWVRKIEIFQSIETVLPRMTILLNDISDQREVFDIRGGITVDISIKDYYGHNMNMEFILNEVKELWSDSIGNNILTLTWYKKEHFHITYNRVYKSYNNITPSNLVKRWLPKAKVSSTRKIDLFNCYGETVNKNIRRLSYISESVTGDGGFLYFETLDDIYFMTLNDLIRENKEVPTYRVSTAPDYEYNLIDMIETKHYQTINVMNQNIFKVKTTFFDFKTKRFITKDVSTKGVNVDKDNLYMKDLAKESKEVIVVGSNQNIEKEVTTRTIFNRYQKKYEVLINGSFDIYPGKVIYIEVPARNSMGNFSKEHNGRFLITKTAHHIENGKMMLKCEVVKDGRN